tara:strand:- start:2123 stop:2494 length:372 start_codon:yes stop_codon:yes gene_type:complete
LESKKYKIAMCVWFIIITTLSLVSFNTLPFKTIASTDKIVHFTFYFVLTLLLIKSFNPKSFLNYFTITGLAITYGIIIEVIQQSFTVTRKGEILDVIANTTGVIFALLSYIFVVNKIYRLKIK